MPERTVTVLVIEDEETIRATVRWILEDAGYTVLEAANGREGLDLLRASAVPLVVLLDQMMPRMSGLEMLHALAADPEVRDRHTYILFSAARVPITPRLSLHLPRKRPYTLPKPFDLDRLVALVEQADQQLDSEKESAWDTDAVADQHKAVVGTLLQSPFTEGTPGGE